MTPGGWMTLPDRDADVFDRLTPAQRAEAKRRFEVDGEVFLKKMPDGSIQFVDPETITRDLR